MQIQLNNNKRETLRTQHFLPITYYKFISRQINDILLNFPREHDLDILCQLSPDTLYEM